MGITRLFYFWGAISSVTVIIYAAAGATGAARPTLSLITIATETQTSTAPAATPPAMAAVVDVVLETVVVAIPPLIAAVVDEVVEIVVDVVVDVTLIPKYSNKEKFLQYYVIF